MTLGIANTYSNTVDNTSGTATCAITRAAGEGLLFGYWYDYDFGAPSAIASATWDPSGDNQALTLVALRQLELSGALENRYFALYQLKNPTSAKSGNVVIVHAGTTLSRGAFLCRNIIDFDPVTWITAFNSRTEANPLTNDLPNTVNSASGELGVFFGAMRNEVAYIAAGDLGSYAEQVVLAGSRSLFSGSKVSVGSTVSGTFAYDDPGTNYDNALIAVSIAPASGGTSATATGVTVAAAASLIPGTASGAAGATAAGVTITAAASLLYAGGTLQFQAAGMEFGSRSGLGISTFGLDAAEDYRYTVHADGLVLGSALITSSVVATDSGGKLPNLVNTLIAPGVDYRVMAIRQADGEAATFRMKALA